MAIPLGPTNIVVGLNSEGVCTFFIVTDPRKAWQQANPGLSTPPNSNFKPLAIGATTDPEVAIWLANLGDLKTALSRMANTISANSANPMAAVTQVQGLIGWVMNLVSTSDAQAIQLTANANKQLAPSAAKQGQARQAQKSKI